MDSDNNEKYKLHYFPHLQIKRRRKLAHREGQYSSSTNLERMIKEHPRNCSHKGESNEKAQPRKQKAFYSARNHLLPLPDTGHAHPEDSLTRNQMMYNSESGLSVSLGRGPGPHLQDQNQFVPDAYYDHYYGQHRRSYPFPPDYETTLQVYPELPMTSTPYPRNSLAMLKRDHYGSGTMYPLQSPQSSSVVKDQLFYRHPGLPNPSLNNFNYSPQYEPQRKIHHGHGYEYQNPDSNINFDIQRRTYPCPEKDRHQIHDYCASRDHPYYARGFRGWPCHQRSKEKQYTSVGTDKINPPIKVQSSQLFSSTLDKIREGEALSSLTDDNFTELEMLRGDDLGVIKNQPLQHPNNIPKLDAGHEHFWDSPMTMMGPDSGFDHDMDGCHLIYNKEITSEIQKSRNHCLINVHYPTRDSKKGTAPQTITSKCMGNTELKNSHTLDKKVLKTHQKLADLNQKHCTGNRVLDHQLRCLDKVAQWISTLDVMPSLSSTTSGIDMEHFDTIESPEVTPNYISAEPKEHKQPEPLTFTVTNDKMEIGIEDNEEQVRNPGRMRHHSELTDIDDQMEEEATDGIEKGNEPEIQCHNLSSQNGKTKIEKKTEGDESNREAILAGNISQHHSLSDSQSDPGVHPESTVEDNEKQPEDYVIPQAEKSTELLSERKDTDQNEGTTVNSNFCSHEHRKNSVEIDDAGTSIFEELNFIYYQGETNSNTATDDSSHGGQPDTDFILKALASPWKEIAVLVPQSTRSCDTLYQEKQQDLSTLDDVCSSLRSPSKATVAHLNNSRLKTSAMELQAAEPSIVSSQLENPPDDSLITLSGDALFQENQLDDRTHKEASMESKSCAPQSVPVFSQQENNPDYSILEEGCGSTTPERKNTLSSASCMQECCQDDLSYKDVSSSTKFKLHESHHQGESSFSKSQDSTLIANREMDLSTIGSDASTLSTLHCSGIMTESLVQATKNAYMIDMAAMETSTDKTLKLNKGEHTGEENGNVSTACEPMKYEEALSKHSATSGNRIMSENHLEASDSVSGCEHSEFVKTHLCDISDDLNAIDIDTGEDTSTLNDSHPGGINRQEMSEKKKSTPTRKRSGLRKSSSARKLADSKNNRNHSSYKNQEHQKQDGRHKVLLRGKSSYNLRKLENSVLIELENGFNWTAEISESPHENDIQESINGADNNEITIAVSPKLTLNFSKDLNTDRKKDLEPNTDPKCDAPISCDQEQLGVYSRNLRSRSRSTSIAGQNVHESQQSCEKAGSSSSAKGMIISVQRKTVEQVHNDPTTKVKCGKGRCNSSKKETTSAKNLKRRTSIAFGSNTSVPCHSVATSTVNELKNRDSIVLPTCNVKPCLKTIDSSRVSHKQRSTAKLAVKPNSVAFSTSFHPKEENIKGKRGKKASTEGGNPRQGTRGQTSSIKASEIKTASKRNSNKTEPKKNQRTNMRSTPGKLKPHVNLNAKKNLGSGKVDMVIPCSVDVKHFKLPESKTKRQKTVGSCNIDDNVPKQKKVSKTSNMSQRFAARPWKSPSTSEINTENSPQTNLESLEPDPHHVQSKNCSTNTTKKHPCSKKCEERSRQKHQRRCASNKSEQNSTRITKQTQFHDSKKTPRSAAKNIGGISKSNNKTSDQSASNMKTRRRLQSLYSPSMAHNDGEQVNSTHPENTVTEQSKNILEVSCGDSSKIQTHQILNSVDSKSENIPGQISEDCTYTIENSETQKSSESVSSCLEPPPSSKKSKLQVQRNEEKSVTVLCPVKHSHPETMCDSEGDVETQGISILESNDETAQTESTSNMSKVVKSGRTPSKTLKKGRVDILNKKTKPSCHRTEEKGSTSSDSTRPDQGQQTSNFGNHQYITDNTSTGSLQENDTGNQSLRQSENIVQDSHQDTLSLQDHATNLQMENKKVNGDMELASSDVFQSLKAVTDVNKTSKCPSTERASLPSKSVVKQQKLSTFGNGDALFQLKKLLRGYASNFSLKTKNYAVEKQKVKDIATPKHFFSRIPSIKLFHKMLPQIQRLFKANYNLELKKPPLQEQTYYSCRYFNKMLQPKHKTCMFNRIIHEKHQNNLMHTIAAPDPQNGVWVSRVPEIFNEPLTELYVNESLDSMSILSEDLSEYDKTGTSGLLTDVLFGSSTDLEPPEPNNGSIKETMDDLRLQIDIGEMLFSTQLNYENGLNFESMLANEDDNHSTDNSSQLDLIMDSIELYDTIQDSINLPITNEGQNIPQLAAPLENPKSDKFNFSKESSSKAQHSQGASYLLSPCSSVASISSSIVNNQQNPEIVMPIHQHLHTPTEIVEKPKQHILREALESNLSHEDLMDLVWKFENDRPAIGNLTETLKENDHRQTDLSVQNSFRKVGLFLELDNPRGIDKYGVRMNDFDDCSAYSGNADVCIDDQITQMILHDQQTLPSRQCSDMNSKGTLVREETTTSDPFGVKSFVREYQMAYPVKQETIPVQCTPDTDQVASMDIPLYQGPIKYEVVPFSLQKCNAKTCETFEDPTISSIVENVRISKAKRKCNQHKSTLNLANSQILGATESYPKSKKAKVNKNVDLCSRKRATKSLPNSVQIAKNMQTIAAMKDLNQRQVFDRIRCKSEKMKREISKKVQQTPKALISKSKQKSSLKIRKDKASDSSEARKCKRTRSSSPILYSPMNKAAATKLRKHKRSKSCGAKVTTVASSTPSGSTIGKRKGSSRFTKVENTTRSKRNGTNDMKRTDDSAKKQPLYTVECRYCQEVFVEEEALRIHSLHEHDTEEVWKNVICGYCPKVYGRKYRFHCHLLTKHSNEDWERHPCPYCQKEFPPSYRLQRHIREHILQDNLLSYKCSLCNARSSYLDRGLPYHFKTKHEEFHVKLLKQYHSSPDVEENLQIFVCRYCGVFRLSLIEFKQHVKDSHISYLNQFETDEVKDSFVLEILERDKLQILSENCYLCIYCSKKLDSVEEVNDHITENHSQMKQCPLDDTYYCDFCNFSAVTPSEMKKHIGKNHWFIESLITNSAIMHIKFEN